MKFKKTPIPVEAVQLDREETIDTLEGRMTGQAGDWRVTGPLGESWFVKRHVFEATYEPIDDEAKAAWVAAYS